MTSSSVDHKKEQVEPAKMMTWSEDNSKESAISHFDAIFGLLFEFQTNLDTVELRLLTRVTI